MGTSSKIVYQIEEVIKSVSQSVIETGVEVYPDGIEELANSYSEAVKQAMVKARHCLELLKKNSMTKALELAKQKPDLQQEYNNLNFDQLKLWLEICEGLSLSCTKDVSTELKEILTVIATVYRPSDKIASLLKSLKLFSLAKAPLAHRVKIVRALYRENPTSKERGNDLQLFEKNHLEDLIKLASSAKKNPDLLTLEKILDEIKSNEWSIKVPQATISQVENRVLECRRKHAQKHYQELCEKIHQAQSSLDEVLCRDLVIKWDAIFKRYNVKPSVELQEQVEPTIQWIGSLDAQINEDNKYTQTCQRLEMALEENTKLETLESIAGEILSFERGIPDILTAQFNSRVQELKLKKKRHFTLSMSATIGLLIILSATIIMLVYHTSKQNEIANWESKIKANLANDKIEAAASLISQVPQKLRNEPKIIQLTLDLKNKQSQEESRASTFSLLVKSLLSSEVKSLNPEQLQNAEKLALTPDEKNQVTEIRIQYDTYLREQKQIRQTAFEQRLEQLEAIFEELGKIDKSNADKFLAKSNECLILANKLASENDISQGLLARARSIQDATLRAKNDIDNQIRMKQSADRDLSQIVKICNTPNILAEKLKLFVKEYPSHEYSLEFSRSVSLTDAWLAGETWRTLFQSFKEDFFVNDVSRINERFTQIENYLKSYPNSPYKASIVNYKNYLEKAKLAVEGGNLKQSDTVMQFLNSPLMSDAMVIGCRNGDQYYMVENTVKEKTSAGQTKYYFRYVIDASLTSVSGVLEDSEVQDKLHNSPQSDFVKLAKEAIEQYNAGKLPWNMLYLEMARDCVKQNEIDAILAANVLKVLLLNTQQINPFQDSNISQLLTEIDNLNLDVPWMNPKDSKINVIRKQAKTVIKKLEPEIIKCCQYQLDLSNKLKDNITPYDYFGIVLGEQKEVQKIADCGNGYIFVVASAAENPTNFLKLGEVINGRYIIDQSLMSQVVRGTPVYFKKHNNN